MKKRVISWFSNGAASAVASKIAVEELSQEFDVRVICCDTRPSEHEDNYRFSNEVQAWIGKEIQFLSSTKYVSVDQVFESVKYMSGTYGAPCTRELKKVPRLEFAEADDIHIFGYTYDEQVRIKNFKSRNPELITDLILDRKKITKSMSLYKLHQSGIELPMMYRIFSDEDRKLYGVDGFDNNNCPGCVKSTSQWYWSMIRKYFPDVFQRRVQQSRATGCRLIQVSKTKRIFLDELPDKVFKKRKKKENLSCGPECGGNAKF